MDAMLALGLMLSVLLGAYLLAALLKPEIFS